MIIKTLKFISYIIILVCISIFITLYVIEENYKNYKICRENDDINIKDYLNIKYVKSVKLLSNCDKTIMYFEIDNIIDSSNVNGLILSITNIKKEYDDDHILEVILKNDKVNFIVIIDQNERIDITY